MKEYCKKLEVGDIIRVTDEVIEEYTVKATSGNFIICTRPYLNSVMYFIIDIEKMIRGANNKVFNPYNYNKEEDIMACLKDLENKECEVTGRYFLPLDIIM